MKSPLPSPAPNAAALATFAMVALLSACSAGNDTQTGGAGQGGRSSGGHASFGGMTASGGGGSGPSCGPRCSADGRDVLSCEGAVEKTCDPTTACDLTQAKCVEPCLAAEHNKSSVGCDYYATFMDTYVGDDACFVAIVANTWTSPAKIEASFRGAPIDLAQFARIPSGPGPDVDYGPYDPEAGIPPGEVAILFLSGLPGDSGPRCRIPSAVPSGVIITGASGIGDAFHLSTDVPVVAYQMNPFGGGNAAVTGASLLLPTSAWDKAYIAADAYPYDIALPSMNLVAAEDDTHITLLPVADVAGGNGIPPGAMNVPLTITLQRGQHAQLSNLAELTGSSVVSDKPIGLMAGHECLNVPSSVLYCDHAEQMVPPVSAMGSKYAAVMHRPRGTEPSQWRLIGAVDDTELTWTSDVGGPTKLAKGQIATFTTAEPFVVEAQDKEHPFLLFSYMLSSEGVTGTPINPDGSSGGYGDPDMVLVVPTDQYLSRYTFFTDPTYPETNLVVVRKRDADGQFAEVELDCAGTLGDWTSIGDFEWTRVDLSTGDFEPVGACTNGVHTMTSSEPFGVWVWGWGTPLTTTFTRDVSYGYPAGMNARQINDVVISATPQ